MDQTYFKQLQQLTPYQQFVSARQREQDLEAARDEALFGDTLDAARRIRGKNRRRRWEIS